MNDFEFICKMYEPWEFTEHFCGTAYLIAAQSKPGAICLYQVLNSGALGRVPTEAVFHNEGCFRFLVELVPCCGVQLSSRSSLEVGSFVEIRWSLAR